MKKVYLMLGAFLSFFLMSVLPAQAQVESMVDLYGTYKFTSKMEVTEAGQAYATSFAAESDVVITKDDSPLSYDASISGIAGGTKGTHPVNGIYIAETKFKVQNWGNNSTIWADGIYMSNADGIYPFGWGDMPQLGDLYFTYDDESLDITVPDFTLVICDHAASTATILAKFTECKLTHISSEKIDIVDISGEWHAKAVGTYGSDYESEIPSEYDFVLTKVSEEAKKHNYTMDLSIEGFNTITLNATFDGNKLNVPLDSVVFDAEKKILAVNMYSGNPHTTFGYTFSSERILAMDATLCLAQYVADVDSTGAPITRLETVQWWMGGNAKKALSDDEKFDWSGTWNVTLDSPGNLFVFDGFNTEEFPSEFKMVVIYDDYWESYYVTEFLGKNVGPLNYGGISLTPSEDDPKLAELAVDKYIASITPQVSYYKLYDGLGTTNNKIQFKVQEDGSIKIGDFFVEKVDFDANTKEHAAFYGYGITATKEIVEPFDFVGTYTVSATPEQVLTDYEYPSEFAMEITYSETYEKYYVTTFLGNNIYQMTQGGIPCEREGNTLKIAVGDTRYVRSAGANEDYSKMWYDTLGEKEGGENGFVTITVNEDGTISIDDFCIYRTTINYDSNWNVTGRTSELACRYTNGSVVTGLTGIEDVVAAPANVKGVYTLFGVRVGNDASDLEALPSGIYIVNDGVKSYKVAR